MLAIGLSLMLFGIIDPDNKGFNYGPLPVILAGAATSFGGVILFLRVLLSGEVRDTFVNLSAAILLTCFTGIPVSIALTERSLPLYFMTALIGSITLIAWYGFFKSLNR